jgi:hypothetical protein
LDKERLEKKEEEERHNENMSRIKSYLPFDDDEP